LFQGSDQVVEALDFQVQLDHRRVRQLALWRQACSLPGQQSCLAVPGPVQVWQVAYGGAEEEAVQAFVAELAGASVPGHVAFLRAAAAVHRRAGDLFMIG
jgi:hypothetical protein